MCLYCFLPHWARDTELGQSAFVYHGWRLRTWCSIFWHLASKDAECGHYVIPLPGQRLRTMSQMIWVKRFVLLSSSHCYCMCQTSCWRSSSCRSNRCQAVVLTTLFDSARHLFVLAHQDTIEMQSEIAPRMPWNRGVHPCACRETFLQTSVPTCSNTPGCCFQVILKTLISCFRCVCWGLELNSAGW